MSHTSVVSPADIVIPPLPSDIPAWAGWAIRKINKKEKIAIELLFIVESLASLFKKLSSGPLIYFLNYKTKIL
jgi:hypothetical protein